MTEDQSDFYSGYGKYHCFSTQIIVDNERNIVYIHSGFLGHMNDAGQYGMLPEIGPNGALPFPPECYLLADGGYANGYPLVTPFRRNQMNGPNVIDKRIFNRLLKSSRIYVEHCLGFCKTYSAISTRWRHPRWLFPAVAETCTFLAQRHIELVNTLH